MAALLQEVVIIVLVLFKMSSYPTILRVLASLAKSKRVHLHIHTILTVMPHREIAQSLLRTSYGQKSVTWHSI